MKILAVFISKKLQKRIRAYKKEWHAVAELLDEVVRIHTSRTIEVYPRAAGVPKPPPGQGLNVPYVVTLEHVWPKDKRRGTDLKDPRSLSELEKKLRNESAVKLGVRDYGRVKDHADWGCDVAGDAGEIQLGYDRTRGAWTFLGWKLQEM